ncbi:MAG: hypothetical protein HY656_01420 [Acidobacteria bacterium]|nr:hypothetical protein [Acidobacteriota bacterium]
MRPGPALLLAALLLAVRPAPGHSQLWISEAAAPARIEVSYTEPSDAGQAERLRDLAARLKPVADQLEPLDLVEIVIVHSPAEMSRRLGAEDALSGVSYLHGILFLSPVSWQRNPTQEALEHEMEGALVRYTASRLAGGQRLPDWLEQGLVSALTRQPFAPATAELIAARGPLLLSRFEADDAAVGYWAVRYLVEARGGLGPVRQLLRLVAQRPDTFVENLQLVYGVSAGELERAWRQWLLEQAEAGRRERGGEGPLIRDRNP